jgi:hypothetical protein
MPSPAPAGMIVPGYPMSWEGKYHTKANSAACSRANEWSVHPSFIEGGVE